MRWGDTRCCGERGNSLVEFAIVGVVLMLVVFGIIEFGLTLNSNISETNGVREAARQAAVANYNGGDASCTGTALAQLTCFTKKNIGLSPASDIRVSITFPTGTNYAVGQELTICASFPMTSITGLLAPFMKGHFLHAESTMRLEQAPGTSPGSFQDTQLSGDAAWATWCN